MTQTIREALEVKLQKAALARLATLQEMGAPKALIEGVEKKLAIGNLAANVGQIAKFGDLVFTAVENTKYRRGYGATFTVSVGHGHVYLIPGPYGLFLTNVVK